jgi:REP element-mobilizing transposase RayT
MILGRTKKSSATRNEEWQGKHRFEHWARDNQAYFITARCRNKFPAFASEPAKSIFWDRLLYWTKNHGFDVWIASLLINHYHLVGYLKRGDDLGPMMRKLHGSIAKLVNDTLEVRLLPFWVDAGHRDYFDGCLRDEKQLRASYKYVLTQSERHGVCRDHRTYPHTREFVELDECVRLARVRKALLLGVRYKRYDDPHGH